MNALDGLDSCLVLGLFVFEFSVKNGLRVFIPWGGCEKAAAAGGGGKANGVI